jgi:hypothetical protein
MKKLRTILKMMWVTGLVMLLHQACEKDSEPQGKSIVLPPQSINQLSYFSFSGNMNDEAGGHTPMAADVRDLTFGTDRFGNEGKAGDFNGTTTIVEIPDGEKYMSHNSMTLSVWIKATATRDGHFVLGLGAWKGFHLEIFRNRRNLQQWWLAGFNLSQRSIAAWWWCRNNLLQGQMGTCSLYV